jgi:hypothetical protein
MQETNLIEQDQPVEVITSPVTIFMPSDETAYTERPRRCSWPVN